MKKILQTKLPAGSKIRKRTCVYYTSENSLDEILFAASRLSGSA